MGIYMFRTGQPSDPYEHHVIRTGVARFKLSQGWTRISVVILGVPDSRLAGVTMWSWPTEVPASRSALTPRCLNTWIRRRGIRIGFRCCEADKRDR